MHSHGCLHIYTKMYALFVSLFKISLQSVLRLGFLGHILGSVKPLGSTHGTEHFGSNLISRHWDRRAQI